MRSAIAAALLLALAAPSAAAEPITDPAVTQETLAETVCIRGYTRTVRPGWRALRRIKLWLLEAAGEPPEHAPAYQLDHAMPLVLGGDPRDPANMVLQPRGEAARKDRIERKLGCLVCTGQVGLDEARAEIAGDWREAYHHWARVKCRRPR